MPIKIILYALIFLTLTHSEVILPKYIQNSTPTLEDLLKHPYIQIKTSKHQEISDQLDVLYYKTEVAHKNKRKAYFEFNKNYGRLMDQLVEAGIIPLRSMMLHSEIRSKFRSDRQKWSFSRQFVLVVNKKDKKPLKSILKNKRVSVGESASITQLQQKIKILKMFQNAKLQLSMFLGSVARPNQLVIEKVEKLNIFAVISRENQEKQKGKKSKRQDQITLFSTNKKGENQGYGIINEQSHLQSIQVFILFKITRQYPKFHVDQEEPSEQFQQQPSEQPLQQQQGQPLQQLSEQPLQEVQGQPSNREQASKEEESQIWKDTHQIDTEQQSL